MPSWRKKPANRQYLNKRYTPSEQQALYNAALAATRRIYCDVLELWRSCTKPRCRRHRRCAGEPRACLRRVYNDLPSHRHDALQAQVIAGGPRRIPPATHVEWELRQSPLSSVR
ncbi:MAG TPA: hypothetical protein VHU22_06150 [Xanthobacteraceae bacterium]|jgi:hypothetical protein|nr:hypothetical protein [Xanthobacteraceae bacterium]